jgi:hypothetical protein
VEVLTLITSNAAGLSAVAAAATFIWSVFQFIATRRKDQRAREFETYHRLIKELASPDQDTKVTWIDRQVAVVFELRHFPRYFEVTLRILAGLRVAWGTEEK